MACAAYFNCGVASFANANRLAGPPRRRGFTRLADFHCVGEPVATTLIAAGSAVASALFIQGQDVGGDIVYGHPAERELRHVRMRRQHEMGEPIAIEARRLSDRTEGRRSGL